MTKSSPSWWRTSLRMRQLRPVAVLALAAFGAACGGGGSYSSPTAPRSTATVAFVYRAATAIDPAVQAQHPNCVAGVGQTHIHPSWRTYVLVGMTAVGADRWEITFTDVPVGAEQRIRVSDPNVCAANATGAAVDGVTANGVALTRVVDTPGTGVEPGLAFSVTAGGAVTP